MTDVRQIPASSKTGPHRDRLRFDRLPAAYCHADHLTELLPDGLPTSFRDRLQGSLRVRKRLSDLLIRRHALPRVAADDLTTPEGLFARLEGEDLQNAVSRIGAIWHARTIRKIILAEPLRRLIEALGRETYRTALRLIDLSPIPANDQKSDGDSERNDLPDVETLLRLIDQDGLIAVHHWCDHQPAALASRLKLKLPKIDEDADPLSLGRRDHGLVIVDRVVTALAADRHEGSTRRG